MARRISRCSDCRFFCLRRCFACFGSAAAWRILSEDAGVVAAIAFVAFLPYFVFRYYRFKVANHALGWTRFVFAQSPKPYYFALLAALLSLLAATFVLAVLLLPTRRARRPTAARLLFLSFRFVASFFFRFVRSARDVV